MKLIRVKYSTTSLEKSCVNNNLEFGIVLLKNARCMDQRFKVCIYHVLKIIKNKIHPAHNVGNAWISRKITSLHHLGPFQANLSMGRINVKIGKVS